MVKIKKVLITRDKDMMIVAKRFIEVKKPEDLIQFIYLFYIFK